jgi:hypothetical protein
MPAPKTFDEAYYKLGGPTVHHGTASLFWIASREYTRERVKEALDFIRDSDCDSEAQKEGIRILTELLEGLEK